MYVIGIHDGHNATAALLKDGEIIACASEERFTNKKNQQGFPENALKWIKETFLTDKDVDYVALSTFDMPSLTEYIEQEQLSNTYYGKRKTKLLKKAIVTVLRKTNTYDLVTKGINTLYPNTVEKRIIERKNKIIEMFSITSDKIYLIDHHTGHASASYFGASFNHERCLVFTSDSWGDGASATIFIGENSQLKEQVRISGASLGDFYSSATAFLGMKVWEHEYKVMGLAPYARESDTLKVYNLLKNCLRLNPKTLHFEKTIACSFYEYFVDNLVGFRFDWVAAASQKLLEELLVEWIKLGIARYGVNNICVGGGVFMNVKANQKIISLPEVKKFFVIPSSGDESLAIGSAYLLYSRISKKECRRFFNPYLGPEYSNEEILALLKGNEGVEFKRCTNIEKEIALLLSKGEIVARVRGRCEYGARALGNRSILTSANDFFIIPHLNKLIKKRDFWMPFCPSILDEDASKYIADYQACSAKSLPYYMMLALDTLEKNNHDMVAATHPFDNSCRPQVVTKEINPSYYHLLKEFKAKTGRGVILNTSFNLHGYPMVCSPQNAIETLCNSGLRYLALEDFLVWKK